MAEIELKKRAVYAGDVHIALLKEGRTIREACDFVNSLPKADVAEVRHGHWIGLEYDGFADGVPAYDLWECSECGEEVIGEDVPDTHLWCHNCGARMDGGADNG